MKRIFWTLVALGAGYVVAYLVAHARRTITDISHTVDALRWERGEIEKWRHGGDPGKVLG